MTTNEPIPATEEQTVAENNETENDKPQTIDELNRQLDQATLDAKTHWDNLLRKQAECDNLQKRMTRDLEHARKYALDKFSTDLLAVRDSMELGLEATNNSETNIDVIRDGMTLTLKMLTDSMKKFDIVEINPIDEKFNPQWHEAIAMQPSEEAEDGTILHIHQKGYQLNDRLLRPARVVVAKSVEIDESVEN